MRDDLAAEGLQRDLTVGVGDVHHGILRRAHVVADLEADADLNASHALGLDRDTIRPHVLFDDDPRQKLARTCVGCRPRDFFGANLDAGAVDALHFHLPVGVADADFAAGRQRVGVRPLLSRPAGEKMVPRRKVACTGRDGERQQESRRSQPFQ